MAPVPAGRRPAAGNAAARDPASRGPAARDPAARDTADVPVVSPTRTDTRRPPPPLRGMIVRRRWRRLRSGAGWSWTGAWFMLVCWGIWVVSVRGTDLAVPLIGLVLVFATAVLLFVVARVLGRAVLERTLGRDRPSAWPSHLTVAAFLVATGITFLQQTLWIRDAWNWLGGTGARIGDAWRWLADLWPL